MSAKKETFRASMLMTIIAGVASACIAALLVSVLAFVIWFVAAPSTADSVAPGPTTPATSDAEHSTVAAADSDKPDTLQLATVTLKDPYDVPELSRPRAADVDPATAATGSSAPAPPPKIKPPPPLITGETAEFVDIAIAATKLAAISDGSKLVYFGVETPTGNNRRPSSSRVVLMDIAGRKVLAERTFPVVLRDVTINNTGVYIAAPSPLADQSQTLLRLDINDLSTLDRRVIPLGNMISMQDDSLLIIPARSEVRVRLKLPELTELPVGKPPSTSEEPVPYREMVDGVYFDGIVWDNAIRTPQLLVMPKRSFRADLPITAKPQFKIYIPMICTSPIRRSPFPATRSSP